MTNMKVTRLILKWSPILLATVIFQIFFVFNAIADEKMGVGIVLGDPTGLSFKYDMNSRNSVDAALAWTSSVNVHLHGDYLWNKPKLFFLDNYPIDLFFGVGARLRDRDKHKFDDDDDGLQLGVRGPVGLRFLFRDPRIELFTELALVMNLTPSTSVDIDFGIGARYFF